MSGVEIVYAVVAGDSGVFKIVGRSVYRDSVPQDASFPYVVVELQAVGRTYGLDGSETARRETVTVTCQTRETASRDSLSAAVGAALSRAATGAPSIGAESFIVDSQVSGIVAPDDGSESWYPFSVFTVDVWPVLDAAVGGR